MLFGSVAFLLYAVALGLVNKEAALAVAFSTCLLCLFIAWWKKSPEMLLWLVIGIITIGTVVQGDLETTSPLFYVFLFSFAALKVRYYVEKYGG